MAGRKKSKAYDTLNYELVRVNNKHAALCNLCKKYLFNTAQARLIGHRNVCNNNRTKASIADVMVEKAAQMNDVKKENSFSNPAAIKEEKRTVLKAKKRSASNISGSTSARSNSSTSSCSKNDSINSKRNTSMINTQTDKSSLKEDDEISESLAQFFYGSNIPLSEVDSIYFKNFIKKIQPTYIDKIPSEKALSTHLLDNIFHKLLSSSKNTMNSESVLLIGGWNNSSTNIKTIIAMLHNAQRREQVFLEAWKLNEENETGEKLSEIVDESIKLARDRYSTHVYAVVADNVTTTTIENEEMDDINENIVWKSNCNIHIINLLVKDLLNDEIIIKVTSILKEFKNSNLEIKMIEKNGSRMILPCQTRWYSYRDAFNNFIENVHLMRCVSKDSKIKADILSLINDEKFINDVKSKIILLNGICDLNDKCQSTNFTAAEAVDMWINLNLRNEFSRQLLLSQKMALNKYALSAFYLHPFMDKSKLNIDQNKIIFDFLFKMLDGNGLEDWNSFRNKDGFFEKLYEKDIKNPFVFWNLAEMKYPTLANLAIKLLQLPASSTQIGHSFSKWAKVDCAARNGLTFQRLKKLFYIHYSLRIKNINQN